MRTIVTLLALLGALVAGSLLGGCGSGPDIGVSKADPVGALAKIEAACKAKGLTKGTINETRAKIVFGGWVDSEETPGLTFTSFADAIPGYQHHVVVATDESGKVLGVAGEFRSGALVFSTTGTKVETFIATLWKRVSGSPANFGAQFDAGLGQKEFFLAEFTKGKVKGSWRKDSQGQNMKNPHGVVDRVRFRVQ